MRIPAAGDDHQYAVFGGLDSASGHLVHQITPRKDEDAFMTFLDELAQAFPADEPLVVVLDNASYHKSYAVQDWWRAHAGQIQPFFLPALYSKVMLASQTVREREVDEQRRRWGKAMPPLRRDRFE
jgi:hypothetical protein